MQTINAIIEAFLLACGVASPIALYKILASRGIHKAVSVLVSIILFAVSLYFVLRNDIDARKFSMNTVFYLLFLITFFMLFCSIKFIIQKNKVYGVSASLLLSACLVSEASVYIALASLRGTDAGSYFVRADGVGLILTKWTNLIYFRGALGEQFRKKLNSDTNSTWYILNFSPYALYNDDILKIIMDAAHRAVKIKWAYQTPDIVLDNRNSASALMQQFLLTNTFPPESRMDKKTVCATFGLGEAIEATLGINRNTIGDNIKIYHSRAPTFYFAWISVPGDDMHHVDMQNAPSGTFGFVMLYGFFPKYDDRTTFYFDNSYMSENGWPVLDYYFRSTIDFFKDGEKENSYLLSSPISAKPTGYSECVGVSKP